MYNVSLLPLCFLSVTHPLVFNCCQWIVVIEKWLLLPQRMFQRESNFKIKDNRTFPQIWSESDFTNCGGQLYFLTPGEGKVRCKIKHHLTCNSVTFSQGDGNIRYFEITTEKPFIQYLMEFRSPAPQKGLGMLIRSNPDQWEHVIREDISLWFCHFITHIYFLIFIILSYLIFYKSLIFICPFFCLFCCWVACVGRKAAVNVQIIHITLLFTPVLCSRGQVWCQSTVWTCLPVRCSASTSWSPWRAWSSRFRWSCRGGSVTISYIHSAT